MTVFALREYQEEALAKIEEARARGIERQLGVAATGLGKTAIFLSLAERLNVPTLILAHRDELISQAVNRLLHMWPDADVGVVKAERNEVDHQVVVASVQTLGRQTRLNKFPADRFKLVITDECHHSKADSYVRIYDHLGCGKADGPFHLGVTATPDRGDGKGLDDIYDEIVFNYDLLWGIRSGYLSDMRGLRVYLEDLDVSKIKISRGDYEAGAAGEALSAANAPEQIVDAWMEHAQDRKTIVFTPTVATAEETMQEFRDRGVIAEVVSASTPLEERRLMLKRFATGEIRVMCNCGVLTEGFDDPAVSCIVMARPTKTRSLYTQCLSADTEVLTPGGWRGPDDVGVGSSVYVWRDGAIAIESATEKHDRPIYADEEMYEVELPSISMRLTGGHRMVVGRRKNDRSWGAWRFVEAHEVSEFGDTWSVPVSGIEGNTSCPLSDDLIRLAAWRLTDGGVNRNNGQLHISQNEESPSTPGIVSLLNRLGLKYGSHSYTQDTNFGKRSSPCVRYTVSRGAPRGRRDSHLDGWGAVAPWLESAGSTREALSDMAQEQFEVFLGVANEADGSKHLPDGWTRHTLTITKSVEFCEWLQSMAVRRGWKANLSTFTTSSGTPLGRLHLKKIDRATIRSNPHDARDFFKKVDPLPGERVWCLSVPSETLVIRRNGKVSVVGNCVGRGSRRHPDKTDCLVIDVCGVSAMNLVTVPSLFGIQKEEDFEEASLTVAQAVMAQEEEQVRQGKLEARAVELFRKVLESPIAWVAFDNQFSRKTYTCGLGNFENSAGERLDRGTIVIEHLNGDSEEEWHCFVRWAENSKPSDTPNVLQFPNGEWYRTLLKQVDLETAQAVGEDYIRKHGMASLVNRDAKWRKGTPTEKQLELAGKLRIRAASEMTKGELSEAITAAIEAKKAKGRDRRSPDWVKKKIAAEKGRQ